MYKSAFFALFVAASVGCGQQEPPAMYRFAVANDRLFAIEQGTSYGTERAVSAQTVGVLLDPLGQHGSAGWRHHNLGDLPEPEFTHRFF